MTTGDDNIKCPRCGSYEYDTQECAECGFSVHDHNEPNDDSWYDYLKENDLL